MGRRSRARTATDPGAVAEPAPRRVRPEPEPVRGGLTPARKGIALALGMAVVLAALVVVGIALLNGTLGAAIVLAYAVAGSGAILLFFRRRTAGAQLTSDDRIFQTLAGGLLVIAIAFAALALLVSVLD